ncbi:MAG TPA: response regulator [Acidimicrobiales bacterium]|nr:response regulator [Acidimicrobiales bacterium]
MKVLVVDDSRAMRSLLRRILTRAGADEIQEAGDGREAVELLETGNVPDVALVDWNMPVMNGLELITTMRRRAEWRRVAIIMVTTESEQSQVVRALAAGAHEYLIKPFDEYSLIEKLEMLGFQAPASAGAGSGPALSGQKGIEP